MENFETIQKKNSAICENTNIQKEQFIDMLQNVNFVAVRKVDIDFITRYKK